MPSRVVRLRAPALLALGLSLLGSCDDDAEKSPAQDAQKSVLQGGEAKTEAGKALERGRDGVKAAERQLEVRDEKIIEAATPEKTERGQVP